MLPAPSRRAWMCNPAHVALILQRDILEAPPTHSPDSVFNAPATRSHELTEQFHTPTVASVLHPLHPAISPCTPPFLPYARSASLRAVATL